MQPLPNVEEIFANLAASSDAIQFSRQAERELSVDRHSHAADAIAVSLARKPRNATFSGKAVFTARALGSLGACCNDACWHGAW